MAGSQASGQHERGRGRLALLPPRWPLRRPAGPASDGAGTGRSPLAPPAAPLTGAPIAPPAVAPPGAPAPRREDPVPLARGAAGQSLRPAALRRLPGLLWRDHRLMTVAVVLSLVPRALAELAFRPALFTPDSFGYLAQSIHPTPGVWHPLGYPLLLLALHPFHSLAVVTAVQHLMGIATAGLVYAVLRQWGLPAWGAVLAASPALFDSRQVVVESAVLPDALYALLLMLGVAALLTRRGPALGRCAFAGLMIGWASITRANGAPEMAAVLAVLLVQRAGWRAVGATAAGFALPVVTYMGLFDLKHGSFALTESDGMFLWSRSMSFANCAVIRPPAALRPLCPSRQPQHPTAPVRAWSVPAWLYSREPAAYLWAPGAWWRHDAHPGFDARNNSLALRFALRAIAAQPADYARTVASGVLLTFLGTDRSLTVRTLHFTQVPDVPRLGYNERRHLYAYARTTSDTHAVQPYAYFTYIYQEPVYFPGLVFGLVLLAGLAGSLRRWRDGGGPAALPWAVAAVGIVVPVAVHEAHYRYVIPVVPVACLAAGLAFARRARLGAAGAAPAVARQAVPGQALPAQTLPGQPASQQPASWLPSAPAG